MNISSTSTSWPARPDPTEFFKKADADGSGGISKDELSTMMKGRPAPSGGAPGGAAPKLDEIFDEADTNRDGEISEAENAAHLEKMGQQTAAGALTSFTGSTDSLNGLLDALTAKNDRSATREDLVAQLVAELKESGDTTSLFRANV